MYDRAIRRRRRRCQRRSAAGRGGGIDHVSKRGRHVACARVGLNCGRRETETRTEILSRRAAIIYRPPFHSRAASTKMAGGGAVSLGSRRPISPSLRTRQIFADSPSLLRGRLSQRGVGGERVLLFLSPPPAAACLRYVL